MSETLTLAIKNEARRLGFALVGVTLPAPPQHLSTFERWLAEGRHGTMAYLADDSHEPTRVLEARNRDWLASDGIAHALEALDARSRRIVEERWLKVNDDSSGGMTLHELAAEYGISAERVRQIEVAAMKKMRKALAEAV